MEGTQKMGGIMVNIVHLLGLGSITAALSFLGGLTAPVVGVTLLLLGGLFAMAFKMNLLGVGLGLTGVAAILTGLSQFGVNLGISGLTISALALGVLVVSWSLESPWVKKFGLKV